MIITTFIVGLVVSVLALFLFISAFVFLYYQIKDKKIWKDKKELVASILIIILLNGISLRFIMLILIILFP